jgi:hypothetical protein
MNTTTHFHAASTRVQEMGKSYKRLKTEIKCRFVPGLVPSYLGGIEPKSDQAMKRKRSELQDRNVVVLALTNAWKRVQYKTR